MKNVIIITRSFDHQLGGMEIHTQKLARFLKDAGYSVTVLTPELENGSKTVSDTRGLIIVRNGPLPHKLIKYSPKYWRAVRRYLQDHGGEYDTVINISMSLSGLIRRPKSLTKAKIISIFHGTYTFERRSLVAQLHYNPGNLKAYLGIPYCLLFSILQKRLCSLSGTVVAISDGIRASLEKEYHVPASKLVLIENGIDLNTFTYRDRDFDQKPMKVIFLSRLHAEKGLFVLLGAVKKAGHDDGLGIECRIVGGGPLEQEAKTYIANNHLKHVTMTGQVKNIEVPRELQRGDFYVFPTLRPEGQPFSVLEAMSSGLVCIISDVQGPNELIKHGINGYAFESGSVESLRKALNEAYTNAAKNKQYSHQSRKDIEKNHDANIQWGKFAKLIEDGRL